MKNIIKVLFSILILFILCGCNSDKSKTESELLETIKSTQHFVVGINENSKPFGFIDEETGKPTGFDAELIREISKYIFGTDKIIRFEYVTPSNRIMKLNTKEVDVVISTMTITQERLQIVDFSNPYFMTGQALLVKNSPNIRTGKDLDYKKIGIVLGTTAASNIRYIASHVKIVGFKNYQDAYKELLSGNLDAISTDDVILQGLANQNSKYKILPDRYSTEFYGIALRKDEETKSLKAEINKALAALEKSGKIQKLEKKYGINYRR